MYTGVHIQMLASIDMKRVYGIIVYMLFVCHPSVAQNDIVKIPNLPFDSFLTLSNNSADLIEEQDSLIDLVQVEKLDINKTWKLLGLKISDSTSHASEEIYPWTSETNIFKVEDTLIIVNSNTLNNRFEFNIKHIGRTRDWSGVDLSKDWTPFSKGKFLIIKKCDMQIGSVVNTWTTHEYYFEERK